MDEGVNRVEVEQERFTVAALTLIEAYADLRMRGRLSEPGLAAAAFAEVETLMGHMVNGGVDALPYTGADVNELTEIEQEFRHHRCSCPTCIHGTHAF